MLNLNSLPSSLAEFFEEAKEEEDNMCCGEYMSWVGGKWHCYKCG